MTEGKIKATDFVHLHNHSHYSLLDGLQKVPQMLDRTKDLGMSAIALTDHGTLSGTIEFYKEAKKREIKPIIGFEAYMAPRGHLDKNGKIDANPYHLILLAENYTGYQNLMRLVTIAQLDGFYYKPRIDRELLAKYKEGIIMLSGCAGGEVAEHIRSGNMVEAENVVRWYQDLLGPDNYYLELQDHEHAWPVQKQINDAKRELSKKTGVKMVVTADSHYCNPEDREAHEILLCVQTGRQLTDTNRMTMDMSLYLSDPKDVAERWKDLPEVLTNTREIADRCDVEIELGGILIPTFETPEGKTERQYLHELTWQGIAWRYYDKTREEAARLTIEQVRKMSSPEIIERADYELGVLESMGYEGYFLIVSDFIQWGKDKGIIFGPGRGSAAGSLIAYAMNITELDPLKYDLLFERFLNPDRVSMPDIDIDIQDTRRGEVIEYVTEKYGQERVAQIITFGTMAARNAVRDTGRVLGMTYAEVDTIAKLIPPPVQGRHIPLSVSIKEDPDLRKEYQSNARAKRLIDQAMKLEGTIRNNGVHAAGVVIAPEEIVKYAPLQRAQKGGISTQYSMGPVEELGLLKMDFLGLSNLTIINNALRIIRKVYETEIDINTIPLDDEKTFKLLATGDTTGVFQLESAGMKRYIRDLKPDAFDDIVAMVALYRPGPMQWIDDFINRKHGRTPITYAHPAMENSLKSTYGVLVYQEQVMQIAKEMCGFTGGQADTLRKAIGKKQVSVMAKMKNDFVEGAIKVSGADRAKTEEFWAALEDFAAYCFNKSHAACYGLIAYQTAYLKAHFPDAYMAALMTSDHDNIERIAIEVAECRRMDIEVLPPDINESYLEFGVVKGKRQIRFGLLAVKNVGEGPIQAILAAREAGGDFKDLEDFCKRVPASDVNKKVWESLIKCGAFDRYGTRETLLANVENLTSFAQDHQKRVASGQIDIFGELGMAEAVTAKLVIDDAPIAPDVRERLSWEKELLGLYLSSHPLDDYDAYIADSMNPIGNIEQRHEGRVARVGGMITTARKIVTKSGKSMAFVALEDKTGSLELVVFPKAYEAAVDLWEPDKIIAVSGKVSFKDRDGRMTTDLKLMVDTATLIDYDRAKGHKPMKKKEEKPSSGADLVLRVQNLTDTELLMKIRKLLTNSPGDQEAYLDIASSPPKKLRLPYRVNVTDELKSQLIELLGSESIA
jgi:DNA polymerase-3 subunit alpha